MVHILCRVNIKWLFQCLCGQPASAIPSMNIGFVTGELERITWLLFNFFTSLVRILVSSPDRFLTQIIEEFQYSWPYSNLHIICGKCVGLDGGIRSIF